MKITLVLDDPQATATLLKKAAQCAMSDGWDSVSSQHTAWLARQIETAATRPESACGNREPGRTYRSCRQASGHDGPHRDNGDVWWPVPDESWLEDHA